MKPRPSGASVRPTVAALVAACLTAGLMQTVLIPIQAQLPELLDAPRTLTAWVITAAAAGAAAFSPISGRVGDLYGRKRAAMAVMLLFTAGSIIAALTSDVGVMIGARVIQGLAIGVIPLSISIMRDVVPPAQLPAAVALASGMLGGGAAFGMPIGAAVTQWFDWHTVYGLCAFLGVITSLWLARSVPTSINRNPGRFDVIGALGTSTGAIAVLIGIAQGLEWGWLSAPVLSLVVGGLLILAGTNVWMLRARDPLIDVRVAFRRPVLFTNAASLAINFANMGANVVFPQLMTLPRIVGLGLDPLTASFIMMLSALSQMLATPVVAMVGRRIGARAMLILGATLGAAAIASPAFLLSSVWVIVVATVLLGIGFAFVFAAFPQIIMASVPPAQTAAANGLNAQIRTFGTSAGAAIPGAILAVMSGPAGPSAVALSMSLVLCGIAAVIGAGIGAFVPRRPRAMSIPRIQPVNGSA